MFPEHGLSHEELNAFNKIAVEETCAIIMMKIVWISQMIGTHFAQFPRVDAHRIGQFTKTAECGVGQSLVTNRRHCRVPEIIVDNSSAQVVLDAPVGYSIIHLTRKR